MLSVLQRELLTATAERYHTQLTTQAASYLLSRGVTKEAANVNLLGLVYDPAPGHEMAVGMLSIPYISPAGVTALKFRKLGEGTPKYLWPVGQKIGLFNVRDLHKTSKTIAICEGELDTIILSSVVGVPTVGVAGVSQWKAWFPKLFEPYENVIVMADNDVKENGTNPGQELAKKIKEDLPNATVVILPPGKDVNDCYLEYGADWLREKVGL